jgi:hypothetical protein
MLRMTKKEFDKYVNRRRPKSKASKASKAHAARKRVKNLAMIMADTRWSATVKINAGLKCEYCGSTKRLAAHHIFTRSNKAVRHYPPNGACLCSGHHIFYAHKRPHDFRDWITSVRGAAWWVDLQAKAQIEISDAKTIFRQLRNDNL